jgi:uncharacterized protein
MLFSIFAYDVENSLALRMQARPAHIARLEALDAQGHLVLAGPNPNLDGEGFSGSLIVAEFASFEAADQWANEDPYLIAGVYEKVEVKPFKQVFPK